MKCKLNDMNAGKKSQTLQVRYQAVYEIISDSQFSGIVKGFSCIKIGNRLIRYYYFPDFHLR